jgi:hypothetical protein
MARRSVPTEQWLREGSRAQRDPDAWGKTSWLLLGRLPEVTRRKGETNHSNKTAAAFEHQALKHNKNAR